MPRPRFSNWFIQDTFTISAGASSNVDVDQVDTFYPQYFLITTWASTASSTGYSLGIQRGYVTATNGAGGMTVTYTDVADAVTIHSQPTASSSNQVTHNDFAINPEAYPRFLRFVITNLDGTNSMTCKIVGDR